MTFFDKLWGWFVDNDPTLIANSAARIPTQAAIKAYVDALAVVVAGGIVRKGTINVSGNPNYPAANTGWLYVITGAPGRIGGVAGDVVDNQDIIICNTTTVAGDKATVGMNWDIVQGNLVGALAAANNLSELTATAATARANIGVAGLSRSLGLSVDGLGFPPVLGYSGMKAIPWTVAAFSAWKIQLLDAAMALVTGDSATVDILYQAAFGGAWVSLVGTGTKPSLSAAGHASGTMADWTGPTALVRGGRIAAQVTAAPSSAGTSNYIDIDLGVTIGD